MSKAITARDNFNRRVWSEEFLITFEDLSLECRYMSLVKGLEEAGFVLETLSSNDPLSQVSDLILDGRILVRLYLVDLGSGKDLIICYRVGFKDSMDSEDTDTIFKLSLSTIWEDIRRIWAG